MRISQKGKDGLKKGEVERDPHYCSWIDQEEAEEREGRKEEEEEENRRKAEGRPKRIVKPTWKKEIAMENVEKKVKRDK